MVVAGFSREEYGCDLCRMQMERMSGSFYRGEAKGK